MIRGALYRIAKIAATRGLARAMNSPILPIKGAA